MTTQQKKALALFMRQASAGLREAKREIESRNYYIADYDLQNVVASCNAAMREMNTEVTEASEKIRGDANEHEASELMETSKRRILKQAESEEL